MGGERGRAQNEAPKQSPGGRAEIRREDAISAGIEMLCDRVEAIGTDAAEASGERAAEAYEDLCQGLTLLQIKQLNTLIGLIPGRED